MPPKPSYPAFYAVVQTTWPLTAHSRHRFQHLASAAPYAITSVTQPAIAPYCHASPLPVSQTNFLSLKLLLTRITYVACTTNEAFVFEVHGVHTPTSAQPVVEVTQDVPAPSRHSDIDNQIINTPLQPQVFVRFLTLHPDQAFVSRLIHSLTNGFDIGYRGPHTPLTAPNLFSAYQHPTVVDEALQKEVAEHRIAGPYSTSPNDNLHCSGIGVVPKEDGSWRLINHLSASVGHSINDFIDPQDYSLQ